MCGIAGYLTNNTITQDILLSMLSKLVHRGPDSMGIYIGNGYAAGIRRLAINGLKDGNQPLYSMDKDIVVLYNGEIYNSPKLRRELEAKGYHFSTHSDGEVICHLYQDQRELAFERLDGMFAIALWVVSERKLLLVRDIPGEKPLYYAANSEQEVVFSSEIKSLQQYPHLNLTLNRQALWDFPTFLWIPEPETVYNEVKTVPPGHYMIIDAKGMRLRSYRNQFYDSLNLVPNDVIAETRRVVTDAVNSRLLSEVKVGCFLSGGLDSSIVTTLAAKQIPNLATFSIGFENLTDPYHGYSDESSYAEEYAAQLKTNHHTIRVNAQIFRNLLDEFTYYGDQPFSVSSGLGILAIAKEAQSQGIKVLLSGDGADECFGGYSWYRHLRDLPNETDILAQDDIISFQNIGMGVQARINHMSKYSGKEKAWAWHYYAHEKEKQMLFSGDFSEGLLSSLRHFTLQQKQKVWSAIDYISHDRHFYFPNEMLRKVDRMTMACSIEGRVPFASPTVLAFAEKLKYEDMIKSGNLKWVLKEAFSDVLPQSIIKREKHGFNVPVDHWLKNEWYDMIEETFAVDSALFKLGLITTQSMHYAKKMLLDKNRLNGHTLFSYIMLNRWLENSRRTEIQLEKNRMEMLL